MGIKKTKDTPECQNNATDLSAQELPSMGSKGRLAISVRCSSNSDDVKLSRELLVAQANEIIRSRQDPLSLLEVKLICQRHDSLGRPAASKYNTQSFLLGLC